MSAYKELIGKSKFTKQDPESLLALLNKQLEYAFSHSPFYSYLGDFLPLGSNEELQKLPFTDAAHIRRSGKEMLCVPAGQIRRIVSLLSSGTTEAPKRIYFTQGDLQRTVDFFAEGMGWMCSKDDTVAVLLPCAVPDGVGDLLRRGLEALGCRVLPLGLVDSASAYSEILLREKPRVLVGMPWQIRLLSLAMPQLRPERVLLSADYVPESLYPLLEDIWGCRVLSHFGMTETCFGCAVESMLHRGMYLRRNELYAEVIDPKSGEILPPGERGELVLTTLRREAMPLIRYRTGDLARLAREHEGCIEGVYGRLGESPAFYMLQEQLCSIREIYDYTLRQDSSGATSIEALTVPNTREGFIETLRSIAASVLGIDEAKLLVEIKSCPPQEARMYTTGKRSFV